MNYQLELEKIINSLDSKNSNNFHQISLIGDEYNYLKIGDNYNDKSGIC